jgi:hypothetical protein
MFQSVVFVNVHKPFDSLPDCLTSTNWAKVALEILHIYQKIWSVYYGNFARKSNLLPPALPLLIREGGGLFVGSDLIEMIRRTTGGVGMLLVQNGPFNTLLQLH